jgi:xanthine/CO dehydrogenase XdhC/CoxF family maturation factor
MLISSDGKTVGSLSAGCLEDEVKLAAVEVIRTGEPRLMQFDTRRRFGCNGSIEIFIERAAGELRRQLTAAVGRRTVFRIETVFENTGELCGTRVPGADALPADNAYVQTIEPLLRVVFIGDGPEIPALHSLTNSLGWELILFESVRAWNLEGDDRTAVIIATHNYGNDCAALRYLLPLGLSYVGVVGPRRRRDELMLDVLDSGITLNSELFAPAGLHLGADAPEEIALSIVAEIQAVFAQASRISLRDRKAPIHEPPLPPLPSVAPNP